MLKFLATLAGLRQEALSAVAVAQVLIARVSNVAPRQADSRWRTRFHSGMSNRDPRSLRFLRGDSFLKITSTITNEDNLYKNVLENLEMSNISSNLVTDLSFSSTIVKMPRLLRHMLNTIIYLPHYPLVGIIDVLNC